MKVLMTLVAAIAITTAASAQKRTCTVKTKCGNRTYKGVKSVSTSTRNGVIRVKNEGNGKIIGRIKCSNKKASDTSINCAAADKNIPVIDRKNRTFSTK